MSSEEAIPEGLGWPVGLSDAVAKSKDLIAYRFMIADTCLSMLNGDGHKLDTTDGITTSENCTRWEEVSQCVRAIATLANAIGSPTEFHLLDNYLPVVMGVSNDEGAGFDLIMTQLEAGPIGQTPICVQMFYIIRLLKSMAKDLIAQGKIALIVILTDRLSCDGDLVETMKGLEGIPVKVIVRLCSVERDAIKYWQSIDAQIDVDILLLNDTGTEASNIQETNSWLTYGEPLQRSREFGAILPLLDKLDFVQLSQQEIRTMAAAV